MLWCRKHWGAPSIKAGGGTRGLGPDPAEQDPAPSPPFNNPTTEELSIPRACQGNLVLEIKIPHIALGCVQQPWGHPAGAWARAAALSWEVSRMSPRPQWGQGWGPQSCVLYTRAKQTRQLMGRGSHGAQRRYCALEPRVSVKCSLCAALLGPAVPKGSQGFPCSLLAIARPLPAVPPTHVKKSPASR